LGRAFYAGNRYFVDLYELNGTNQYLTSLDGRNWSIGAWLGTPSAAPLEFVSSMAGDGRIYVRAGWREESGNSMGVLSYSTDGLTWSDPVVKAGGLQTDRYSSHFFSVIWGNDTFVAVGNHSRDAIIFTSGDGIHWTQRYHYHDGFDRDDFYDVAYGNYLFVARGYEHVFTSPAQLNAPVITQSPLSQTVQVGANVSLQVAASGSAPLAYQWQKNGNDLIGATNASLVLSNVQVADSGDYSAWVSNPAGATNSPNALLTVIVCSYALGKQEAALGQAGGLGDVTIISPGICAWAVSNPLPWVTIMSGQFGTGNGLVSYFVSSNTAPEPRQGILTIAGKPFRLMQAGAKPWFPDAPQLVNGQLRLSLLGEPGCQYIIESATNLLHWRPVYTNVITDALLVFTNGAALAQPQKFYRAILPAGPPGVRIMSPPDGTVVVAGTLVTLNILANLTASPLLRTELYLGPTKIDTFYLNPYNYSIILPAGAYTFSAKVVYASGETAASAPVQINAR